VIWHDDDLLLLGGRGEGVHSFNVDQLTLAQFRAAGPQEPPAGAGAGSALAPIGGSAAPSTRLLRRFSGEGLGREEPWSCPVEGALPSLADALRFSPPGLAFNLELKLIEEKPLREPQLTRFLAAILGACEQHGASRRIAFSSFDPDAAIAMRRLQQRWPVLLLTDCAGDAGSEWPLHADWRRNGVRAALALAVQEGLAGIVPDSAALLASPQLMAEVRASGLLCATWGAANATAEGVRAQADAGICALITDTVPLALATLASLPSAPPPPAPPLAKGAATAPVRACVNDLPAFLGGEGGVSEALMRAHPITSLRYSSSGGDVNAAYEAGGGVNVWQRPLPEDHAASARILSAALALPGKSLGTAARAALQGARAEATARALAAAAAAARQPLSPAQLAALSPDAAAAAPAEPQALLARLRARLG